MKKGAPLRLSGDNELAAIRKRFADARAKQPNGPVAPPTRYECHEGHAFMAAFDAVAPTCPHCDPKQHNVKQPTYALHVRALVKDRFELADVLFEYRFFATRKWRFDIAWPRHRIAIEIDGGLYINGGHNQGQRIADEHEKCNAAVLLGWRVLHFQPNQLVEAISAAHSLAVDDFHRPL